MIECAPVEAASRPDETGKSGENGMALVEFALIVPFLVILLAGVLEFGRVLDAWVIVTNAAREGARYAALSGRSPNPMYANDIQWATHNYLVSGFSGRTDVTVPPASAVQVTGGLPFCYQADRSTCPVPVAPGTRVTVAVSVNVPLYIPLVTGFFPSNPMPVSGAVTVEVQ